MWVDLIFSKGLCDQQGRRGRKGLSWGRLSNRWRKRTVSGVGCAALRRHFGGTLLGYSMELVPVPDDAIT